MNEQTLNSEQRGVHVPAKIKIIGFSLLVGLLVFPTVTLGGTFVTSLLQGKSVEESVQILATQLDVLIGRVDKIESDQEILEETVEGNQVEVDRSVAELQDELDVAHAENERLQMALEEQSTDQETALKKEAACRRAQELRQAPNETKVAYFTEQANQPVYASWAPDTTTELLKYLQDYMEHYQTTGSRMWMHVPQYELDRVPGHIEILKARHEEYLKQVAICEQVVE